MASDYDDVVWVAVAKQQGPVGDAARAANRETIARLEADGFSAAQTATVIALRMVDARATMAAGLDAYEGLVASIELAAGHGDGPLEPSRIMEHMLESKLRLARLYNFLAGIAPAADVPGVASTDVTQGMVAESESELASWRAAQK